MTLYLLKYPLVVVATSEIYCVGFFHEIVDRSTIEPTDLLHADALVLSQTGLEPEGF